MTLEERAAFLVLHRRLDALEANFLELTLKVQALLLTLSPEVLSGPDYDKRLARLQRDTAATGVAKRLNMEDKDRRKRLEELLRNASEPKHEDAEG